MFGATGKGVTAVLIAGLVPLILSGMGGAVWAQGRGAGDDYIEPQPAVLETSLPQVPFGAFLPETPARRLEVNIPERCLRLYAGNAVLKTYAVGLGRLGYMTPVGQFKVIRMVKNPAWENPYKPIGAMGVPAGRQNPLGTRWIGFLANAQGEYGIHGTNQPDSVGLYSSHGCIRLRVADAEDLFERVEVGMPVVVVYQRYRFELKGQNLMLSVFADPFQRGRVNYEGMKQLANQQCPACQLDAFRLHNIIAAPLPGVFKVGRLQPMVQTSVVPSQSSMQADEGTIGFSVSAPGH